jgi:outer membrane protein OmpA-like peptidoglycan-associated protein
MNYKQVLLTAGLMSGAVGAVAQADVDAPPVDTAAAPPATIYESFGQEWRLHVGGGVSTINYDLWRGSAEKGIGGTFGLDYAHFFNDYFGIMAGFDLALFNASLKMSNVDAYIYNLSAAGDSYRTHIDSYSEKQQALMLTVPLMVQGQLPLGSSKRHSLYLQGGVKLSFPVHATYSSDATGYTHYETDINTAGQANGGGYPPADFSKESKGDLTLLPTAIASAELGMKWRVSKICALYTGIYLDYGVSTLRTGATTTFINKASNVGTDHTFTTNSLLVSQSGPGVNFVNSAKLFAVGLNVRVAFGRASKKAADVSASVGTLTDADYQRMEENARKAEDAAVRAEAVANSVESAAKRIETNSRIEAARQAAEATPKEKEKEKYAGALEVLQEPVTEFTLSQIDIQQGQIAAIEKVIDVLKRYPQLKIIIEGHTCNLGAHEFNVVVGQKRANAAKLYMVQSGIAPERISTVSKAEVEPLVPNVNESSRRANRRVEFKVVQW